MPDISPAKDGGYSDAAKRLNELQDDLKLEKRRAREARVENADIAEERLREQMRKNESEVAMLKGKIGEDTSERIQKARESAKNDVQDLKKQLYNERGKVQNETRIEKEEMRSKMDALTARTADQLKSSEEQQAWQLTKQGRQFQSRFDDLAHSSSEKERQVIRSYEDRVRRLEGELGNRKERGYEAADVRAFRDQQNEMDLKNAKLRHDYEAQLQKVKQTADDAQDNYVWKINQRTMEKDAINARLSQEAAQDRSEEGRVLKGQYNTVIKDLQRRSGENAKLHEKRMGQLAHQGVTTADQAVERAQVAHKSDTESSLKTRDLEIQKLKEKINFYRTSDDPAVFSGNAVETIERGWKDNYAKTFSEAQEQKKRSEDEIIRKYRERLEKQGDHIEKDKLKLVREYEQKGAADRVQFQDGLAEVTHQKDLQQRMTEKSQQKELEKRDRIYGGTVDKMRAQYEEQFEVHRSDSNARLQQERTDLEFQMRMMHREMAAKHSEKIREYEFKLSELKENNDHAIAEIKEQTARVIRDKDREVQRVLEDQKKIYEQRIAIAETQNKERTRAIAQSYEEEMEKVKRSNAILSTKKS